MPKTILLVEGDKLFRWALKYELETARSTG